MMLRPLVSPSPNTGKYNSYRRRAVGVVFLFVLMAAGVALWNTHERQLDREEQSRKQSKHSVMGAARAISQELESLRKQVTLLARGEMGLLSTLAQSPNFPTYDSLRAWVKREFPDSVAVTLADASGRAYVEDFDGYIIEICKNDINRFVTERHPPNVMIHPNPLAYHFDIMVQIPVADQVMVFFVSFRPEVIARLLANSQLFGHRLVLVRQDRTGLIEVTASGSRQGLTEEQFQLTEDELRRVAYAHPVNGTAWILMDIPDEDFARSEIMSLQVEFAVELVLMLVLAALLLRQLARSEAHILEQNKSLARHTHVLEISEARLERAQEIAHMGYWEYNLLSDEAFISEGARRVFGMKMPHGLGGEDLLRTVCEEDRPRVRRSILRAIVGKRPYRAEFRLCRPGGAVHVVHASAELSHDEDGNPLRLFGVVQDITHRRHAEQAAKAAVEAKAAAESASHAKSAFLANMSHEIRTPLTAIIGFGESLLDTQHTPEERQESVRTIIRNGQHLLQIVNDILDLSKIESGKMQIERTTCSPLELLRDVEQLMRLRAEESGLEFTARCAGAVPVNVQTDPLRLKQILLNLCANAIKFTPKGRVEIALRCERADERLVFTVHDTGIGMTAAQLSRIFEPFTQAEAATTRRFGGTGLGLSISKQFVGLLGGDIRAESEPGVGSQFTLFIPTGPLFGVDMVSDSAQRAPSAMQAVAAAELLSGDVLLVEDNPDNQRLIAMLLRRMGVEVTLAENGAVAIEHATRRTFDVILMDMQMPVLDGIEATRRLRAAGYRGAIVALTANAMAEDKERCRDAGCDTFLAKPIDRARVRQVLSEFLGTATDRSPIRSSLLDSEPELAQLVGQFVRNLPVYLNNMQAAARRHDYATLEDLAHQFKGMGGNFGYAILTGLAVRLEVHVDARNDAGIGIVLAELETVLARITAAEAQAAPTVADSTLT